MRGCGYIGRPGMAFTRPAANSHGACEPKSITSPVTESRKNFFAPRWSPWDSTSAFIRTTTKLAPRRCPAWWGPRNGNTGSATCCPGAGHRRRPARCHRCAWPGGGGIRHPLRRDSPRPGAISRAQAIRPLVPGVDRTGLMERVKGIEPSYEAWEAAVLPLNYTRILQLVDVNEFFT